MMPARCQAGPASFPCGSFVHWIIVTCALLFLGIPGAGCDDGKAPPSPCEAACHKLEICNDNTDELGCIQRCDDDAIHSDAYLELRAQCALELSCNLWADELGLMGEAICNLGEACVLDDCIDDAFQIRRPSLSERSYCTSIAAKLSACERELVTQTLDRGCLDLVPALSEELLSDMDACIRMDCASVRPCLLRVQDRYNTEVTLYPGVVERAPLR